MSMRAVITAVCLWLWIGSAAASAEVVKVTVASRAPVADGQAFGKTGAYEKVAGTIEFAIDPANPRNAAIADLARAPRGEDGRVRFTSTFHVLRPVDPALGNGVLLFDIANRGRKIALASFNRAPGSNDPTAPGDFGDGFLMREGYTVVWVGWQFDVAPPLLSVDAPAVAGAGQVRITFIVNGREEEVTPADLPAYQPVNAGDSANTLSVRDKFWDPPTPVASDRWRMVVRDGRPRVALAGGFDPGRIYELAYSATGARVAGVGLAAIRDAAAAFVRRADMPIRGRSAYVFGVSQSGRFVRQFLYDGFNVDEQGNKVFDAGWAHIAGAGLGSFNEPFAMPGYSSFPATRFPFTDREQHDPPGRPAGILSGYQSDRTPRVFYTNSSVEYWGQGRAAALTHTSLDGTRDVRPPDAVRIYLIAGSQHGPAAFPPRRGAGQQLPNPVAHAEVMRALLRALHQWTADGVEPPASRHPTLADQTLVRASSVRFPAIPRAGDPRTIVGPARTVDGRVQPLPFLVPQVDGDGNELAGIRMPEVAVPLATATGWNFRSEAAGNTSDIMSLIGSYIPFAKTRAEREAHGDPRRGIDERYRSRADYLARVRKAIDDLVRKRYVLEQDVETMMSRGAAQWEHATGGASTPQP
jgi:Alpha/beta hydrolase domain